jgi:hypothetical protein
MFTKSYEPLGTLPSIPTTFPLHMQLVKFMLISKPHLVVVCVLRKANRSIFKDMSTPTMLAVPTHQDLPQDGYF